MAERCRTYRRGDLHPIRVTSLDWALSMCRNMLRHVPDNAGNYPERAYFDDEITAELKVTAVANAQNVLYYRPHIAARNLYLGDPYRLKSHSTETYSKTLADAREVADSWLERGASFDRYIPPELLGLAPGGRVKRKRSKQIWARR